MIITSGYIEDMKITQELLKKCNLQVSIEAWFVKIH